MYTSLVLRVGNVLSDCLPGLVFPQSLQGELDGQLVHPSVSVLDCPFSVHLSLVSFLSSDLFSITMDYHTENSG